MHIPPSFLYSDQHLWTKEDADGVWLAGITDYAQDLLGDLVFIDPPKVGDQLQAGTPCGLVESVKTGSDLHALVDGEVVAINEDALDAPESVNDAPYDTWIFKFKPVDAEFSAQLLDEKAYAEYLGSL